MAANFRIGDLVRLVPGAVGMRGLEQGHAGTWLTANSGHIIGDEILTCIGISESYVGKCVLHLLSPKNSCIVHYYTYEVDLL